MNPPASLHGPHLHTFQAIFQHPLSHNLAWRDVHALLAELGQATPEANGHLKLTRHGETLVLHAPHGKDLGGDEAMSLRRFLERSEAAAPDATGAEAHWLLVIDHQEARVFRAELQGAVPQRITPHPSEKYFRNAKHSQMTSRGKERPDPNTFFAPVAEALGGAGKVLIFGAGAGMSSEAEQFIAWAKVHRPEVAARIVGSQAVDESHLSADELLAKARQFYVNTAVA